MIRQTKWNILLRFFAVITCCVLLGALMPARVLQQAAQGGIPAASQHDPVQDEQIKNLAETGQDRELRLRQLEAAMNQLLGAYKLLQLGLLVLGGIEGVQLLFSAAKVYNGWKGSVRERHRPA